MLSTAFMQHNWCGQHKLETIAKDIHKDTNTLIYHARSFDKRKGHNKTVSHDFLLQHPQHASPRKKQKINTASSGHTDEINEEEYEQQQQH